MNLTREQTAVVAKGIRPMLGYLVRLRCRMANLGFLPRPGDPLYELVQKKNLQPRAFRLLLALAAAISSLPPLTQLDRR